MQMSNSLRSFHLVTEGCLFPISFQVYRMYACLYGLKVASYFILRAFIYLHFLVFWDHLMKFSEYEKGILLRPVLESIDSVAHSLLSMKSVNQTETAVFSPPMNWCLVKISSRYKCGKALISKLCFLYTRATDKV